MPEVVTTYPIGIDLDDRCLTAAQFRKTRRGFRVRGIFCRPLAAPSPEAAEDETNLTAALKEVLSSRVFKGRRVAFHLPFQTLSVFPVRFPLADQDNPEEAILREAAKFLPFPLEEAVIDYPSLIRLPEGTGHAVVVAVRREAMNRWLRIIHRAGLKAEVLDFSVSSLIRLHRGFVVGTDQADLLCHIGRTRSLLTVATGEGILAFSEISWGIQTLWDKIQAHLELLEGGQEAVNLLKVYGLGYAQRENLPGGVSVSGGGPDDGGMNMYRALFQIITPAVDELVYECHRTISYVRSVSERAVFGGGYLYGLAGLISHLDRYLEKQLGMPTQSMDALTRLGFADDAGSSGVPERVSPATALGLAMRRVPWL